MGTPDREPQEYSRNLTEYEGPGGYIPIIFLLYSWGSRFGVPSKVPSFVQGGVGYQALSYLRLCFNPENEIMRPSPRPQGYLKLRDAPRILSKRPEYRYFLTRKDPNYRCMQVVLVLSVNSRGPNTFRV